jgi:hypothetical protein
MKAATEGAVAQGTTLTAAIRDLRELVTTAVGHIDLFDSHLDAVVTAALRKGFTAGARIGRAAAGAETPAPQ